jgi:hypothetical protein
MRRQLRRVGVRFVVAVASVAIPCASVAVVLPVTEQRSLRLDVVETAAINQSADTLGISDSNLYFQSQEQVNQTLDAMVSMGVKDVRIMIPWVFVQPAASSNYNWSQVDMIVNAAMARGMGVLGVINSTPTWAGSPAISGHPDPSTYATFAAAVAQRYAGEISAYECGTSRMGRSSTTRSIRLVTPSC